MRLSNDRLPGAARLYNPWSWVSLFTLALLLSACGGGGGGGGQAETPPAVAVCDPADSSTFAECGTLFVGLTDADGDFLSYSVDVVSLELEKANGAVVETLPNSARIDFAQYVDLTEFVTAANIPPGTYVSGSITLDYADAEVFVEAGGAAKAATVVDADGAPLGRTTLRIALADRNRLVITRGRPALLTVDFDLGASHVVDLAPDPATATAEPFILAEIDPVEEKEIRVRGPVVAVDEAALTYTVALRPFYRPDGDFGRVVVHIADETEFEVDEMLATGADGLALLAAAGTGTASVALGTLDVAAREFTADLVLAGSSVPGNGLDALHGNVIARHGNELVVRGATIVPRSDRPFFRDDVVVTVGPDTRVFKRGHDALLDIGALSVGQAVTVRGSVTANDELGVALDATAGAVRMHVTRVAGIARSVTTGQLDIELQSIDRRRAAIFDFTGTGPTPDLDADPANYEIATGALSLAAQAAGKPVVVLGFPTAFGTAPPDFDAGTVVDFAAVRSVLGIGWGSDGSTAPFLSMNADGLVLDNTNPAIDLRHYVRQGPVLIDLTALDSGTLIVPATDGRTLYALKTADSLQLYAAFDEFVDALTSGLDGANAARSMYARGSYDADANVFTARTLGVHLLEAAP